MKKFEDFKEYLNKNNVEVSGDLLSALEVYHNWLQTEALKLDGKEVRKVMIEECKRRGEQLFM
ncbi:MAG: hypothetical protein NC548_65810 [Lachnospiraceae bacterium]|nr:hypothetical protein [Lachnospiraceae bacterium]